MATDKIDKCFSKANDICNEMKELSELLNLEDEVEALTIINQIVKQNNDLRDIAVALTDVKQHLSEDELANMDKYTEIYFVVSGYCDEMLNLIIDPQDEHQDDTQDEGYESAETD